MAFWLDRFRRPDEEDIWEELKQMLINSDKYEAEKKLHEARELEAFNKAWDKANGVNTELASPKNSKEKLTGKATPVLEGNATHEKHLTPYEEIDLREDWSDELKSQKKAEVAKIQEVYEARNKEINREHILEQAKNYGGAALEIGSAALPGYGTAKLATTGTRYLGKKLVPTVGRKFAKQIEKSTAQGAIMGGLEGAVRGSLEDENVAKTIAQDTLIGALGGATLGTVLGRNAHVKRKKNLDELLDKRKDWGIAFTKQSGKPAEAIEKLLEQKQGFVPKATKKRGIGDIDFVWGDSGKGLRHVIERRNAEGIDGQQFVKELPDFLKNSKVYKKKEHIDRKYIGDNHKEASIKADYNKKPRNWLVSSYNLKDEAPLQDLPGGRALEQTYASGQQISPPDLTKVPHSIITNSNSNLNPSQPSIQKPLSHNEWLEELKRRRKKGWW